MEFFQIIGIAVTMLVAGLILLGAAAKGLEIAYDIALMVRGWKR